MRFFFVSYPFVRLIVFLPQSGCPEKNSATGRHHFLSEDASCLATDSFFFVLRKGDSGSSVRKNYANLSYVKRLVAYLNCSEEDLGWLGSRYLIMMIFTFV